MMDGQVLQEVKVFKYLESLVTAVGELRKKYNREFWKGVKYWEPLEAF